MRIETILHIHGVSPISVMKQQTLALFRFRHQLLCLELNYLYLLQNLLLLFFLDCFYNAWILSLKNYKLIYMASEHKNIQQTSTSVIHTLKIVGEIWCHEGQLCKKDKSGHKMVIFPFATGQLLKTGI